MPEQRKFGTELSGNRQIRCQFNSSQKAAMCEAQSRGDSYRQVAREFNTQHTTVSRICQRWNNQRTLQNKPRKGRPKKSSDQEILYITILLKRDGKKTWDALVLFSDESSVANAPDNRCGWVFRKPGERIKRDIVHITIHGKANISVMVWAGIWRGARTRLVIMERDPDAPRRGYQNASSEGLVPIYNGTRYFQQDNARIHNFGGTPEWLQIHGIAYIDWPPHSPHLIPIEHAWDLIDQDLMDRLIESMPRRLAAVRAAQGWYTQY
ncbi:transposase [Trichoderma austrokoningii]